MNAETRNIVARLQLNGEDREWYPSTKEIIDVVKDDIQSHFDDSPSVLDCGAGDGRVLEALTDGKKYAIEKAKVLLKNLNKDIFVVGTDFDENTLIDKKVRIVFSNPPYSVFSKWATKIITEANASIVYLVLPQRWKDSEEIMDAIKLRGASADVIGCFDFESADRAARAVVNVIRVSLACLRGHASTRPRTDPFNIWFDQYFKLDIHSEAPYKSDEVRSAAESLNKRVKNELVSGLGLVSVLEDLYQRELQHLIETYQSLSSINPGLLEELGVNVKSVRGALAEKIDNLKDRYWHELFNCLNAVTDRLTVKSRKKLLNELTAHTHIDFTSSNAHAVVMWVIKNANSYFDEQVIDTVLTMTDKCNIVNYKSNQRTFGDNEWRYCRMPDISHYALDYRIVVTRMGGLERNMFSEVTKLADRGSDFINDLCTIATNLGYNTYGLSRADSYKWAEKGQKEFEFRTKEGEIETLFTARAYLNGNIHIKLNTRFIMRLNIEFGRLKGWVKSAKEAAEEMGIDIVEAAESFGSNMQLADNSLLKLGFTE